MLETINRQKTKHGCLGYPGMRRVSTYTFAGEMGIKRGKISVLPMQSNKIEPKLPMHSDKFGDKLPMQSNKNSNQIKWVWSIQFSDPGS